MRISTTLTAIAALTLVLPAPDVMAAGAPGSLDDVLANEASLRGVAFVDPAHGWAVGDRGLILQTDDGGRTWRRALSPTAAPLGAVSFVDARRGWAVGGSLRPYTHESRGVVLATDNGGGDWRVVCDSGAPRFRVLRMLDERTGLAAGDSTPTAPSGVWRTDDGGQSWRPLPGEAGHDWLAGDFAPARLGDALGVVAGRRGVGARLAAGGATDTTAAVGLGGAYAVALADARRGWLVGDGGAVRQTLDGGASWEAPPAEPPQTLAEGFSWRAVACRGEKVWIAGSPGSIVLRSEDGGQSWESSPTGVSSPLTAMTFVDEQRGWAVGEFGVILATEDGGRTWSAQRGADRRAALLVVVPTVEDLPAEVLALAAAAGCRTAVTAPMAPETPRAAAEVAGRLADAAELLGADAAHVGWATPLGRADAQLTRAPLLERLNRLTDAQAAVLLADELHRAILAYRPDLVAVAGHGGAADLLGEAAVAAAQRSAKTPPAAVGLPPWMPRRVARVATTAPDETASAVQTLSTGDFASQLGTTASGWRADARGLLNPTYQPSPPTYYWWTLAGDPATTRDDLFGGAQLQHGGPARHEPATASINRLDQLRRVTEKRRSMERLLAAAGDDPAWAGQVINLTGGLDAEAGAQLLRQLAEACLEAGRPEQAAETQYLIARRYPGSPLADAALVWLAHHYSSGERLHTALRGQLGQRQDAPDTLANVEAAPGAPAVSGREGVVTAEERLERATQLLGYLRQAHPDLYARPALQMAEATVAREQGVEDDAHRITRLLANQGADKPWRRAAEAERWLEERAGPAPEKPTAACHYTNRRPKLDGVLDDPAWSKAEPIGLVDPLLGEPTATVRFARDDAFLFVAIEAQSHAAPVENSAPRPRDADLAEQDRVRLRIDVDRDYTTAYELTIDSRGWTRDTLWGDRHWNPDYWVAATARDGAWRAEAAIPLAELTPADRVERAAWAVSLERLRPTQARAAWPAGDWADDTPDAFGLLLLD